MKDRTPRFPGRVILNPVSGQANTFDVVRADEPLEEGTPINKQTLLTDDTAAEVWPAEASRPADPTVDDALLQLSKYSKIAHGSYTGTGYAGTGYENVLTADFAPKMAIVYATTGVANSDYEEPTIFLANCSVAYRYFKRSSTASSNKLDLTWGANSLTWVYSQATPGNAGYGIYQLNSAGTVYQYILLG